jgi:cytochrome c oxidase cbb3-type subunit I/II
MSRTSLMACAAGCCILLVAAGVGAARAQTPTKVGNLTGNAAAGKQDYRRFCVGCHGANGDGLGENAQWIDPKPRDFTTGVFKCRSTPTGTLPTDEDLFRAVTRGFITTNMPSWMPLGRQMRVDLVAYIKTFSSRWKAQGAGTPISVPPEPAANIESILRGRALFQKMECWKCHGPAGHGDGPSASTLTDSKDNPIRPYNFASGSRFKCGETNEDLYRIFMTGVDGTPMPSFADNIQPEDAWDLVHFLRTLQPLQTPEALLWNVYLPAHAGELKPLGPELGQ